MHLQVVNASGEPISVSKSFIRYLVLSAPFFLNRLTLPITRTPQIVMYLLTTVDHPILLRAAYVSADDQLHFPYLTLTDQVQAKWWGPC